VSAAAFQAALAALVADQPVRAELLYELSERERGRYTSLVSQRGVPVMRMLYFGWRLAKVLSLLPLTTKAIGDQIMALHLRRFWSESRATSYYFVDEVFAFIETLERYLPSVARVQVAQILSFEKARLTLRRAQSRGQPPTPLEERCQLDVPALLSALEAGTDLTDVPAANAVLRGQLTRDGEELWTIVPIGEPSAAPPNDGFPS
jgi:hypothetical protein